MTTRPTVLITGAGGQDGSYLAEDLLARGWAVWGTSQSGAGGAPLIDGVHAVDVDLSDPGTCRDVVADVRPDFLIHLAALSSVAQSWERPVETTQVNALAAVALMEECLALTAGSSKSVRFVNASSAEIFAGTSEVPQNESTPLSPTSPYGIAKAFSHTMVGAFRIRGLWAANAILYNHESPRRPTAFVTRKITHGAAEIAAGLSDKLALGNLDVRRDWGWAPDYVDALVRIALADEPDDFVVATGESHSVREFAHAALTAAGVEDWADRVTVDERFNRPADGMELVGDPSKARSVLGWAPTKTFTEVVAAMVEHDLSQISARIGPEAVT
ncbi:GDP-mannose 4,6-dehydratase [Actinomycetes bacterium M1A6_2h]